MIDFEVSSNNLNSVCKSVSGRAFSLKLQPTINSLSLVAEDIDLYIDKDRSKSFK